MKVIQVIDSFKTGGGVNSFVYDMCFALKEIGCDVSLIGITDSGYDGNPLIDELRHQGVIVECLGAKSKKDAIFFHIRALEKTISSIAKNNKTICNLHLKLSVLMGVLATIRLQNVKCVETYHNTYHHYHIQCWLCAPFIKKYVTVSETAKKEMHTRFGIPFTKIVSIPNGVSRQKIRELAAVDTGNKTDDKTIKIVSIGRLSYEKNFSIPLSACVNMCNKHLTYTMIGDGPQKEMIQNIVKGNDYMTCLGALPRQQTMQELAKADLVIMPSLWEGRSILQLEALALDKPMIISDVPGLREPFGEDALKQGELFRKTKFGYIVQTNNSDSYRAALEDYKTNRNEDYCSYLSRISMDNDISLIARRYYQVYNEICDSFVY